MRKAKMEKKSDAIPSAKSSVSNTQQKKAKNQKKQKGLKKEKESRQVTVVIIKECLENCVLSREDVAGQLEFRFHAKQNNRLEDADRIDQALLNIGIHVADLYDYSCNMYVSAAAPSSIEAYDFAKSTMDMMKMNVDTTKKSLMVTADTNESIKHKESTVDTTTTATTTIDTENQFKKITKKSKKKKSNQSKKINASTIPRKGYKCKLCNSSTHMLYYCSKFVQKPSRSGDNSNKNSKNSNNN
jgi:hypothetical protein